MILVVLAGVMLNLSLGRGILYIPVYYAQTRKAGARMPAVAASYPFGFRRTRAFSRALAQGKLLRNLLDQARVLPRTRFIQFLFRWQLLSNDPENVKVVLSTKFKDFGLGYREKMLGYAFGRGIFTIGGQEWKHSRALMRPQFAREQISQLGSVDAHLKTLFKAIDREQRSSEYIDIQQLFHEFTIDTATEFLFGESLKSLEPRAGLEVHHITAKDGRVVTAPEFVESYQAMVMTSARRLLLGEFGWLINSKAFRGHIERARVVVDYYVDRAMEAVEQEAKPGKYVFSHALAREKLGRVEIRDQIFNILIAGRDTTAVTLTFMTMLMCQHPEVWADLRREVSEVFGKGEVTFEQLRTAKLLNAVISETLRLYPVVPTNQRTAVRDVVLPRGGGRDGRDPIFVAKGTSVAYQYFVIHRDPEFWGADADEFRPSRWLQKSAAPAWAYLPFNGGPRICLGQQFALTELALVFVRIAQRYSRLDLAPDFGLDLDMVLTLKSRRPVMVRMRGCERERERAGAGGGGGGPPRRRRAIARARSGAPALARPPLIAAAAPTRHPAPT